MTPKYDIYNTIVDYEISYEYSYKTYSYGLCQAYDSVLEIIRGVLVKLDPGSGQLMTMRFLPRDNYDDVNN